MNAALSVAKYKVSYSPRQWPRVSYSSQERQQEVGVLGSTCMLHPSCRRAGAGRRWDQGLTPSPDPRRPGGGHNQTGSTFAHEHFASLCSAFAVGSFVPSPLFPGSFPALPQPGEVGEADPGRHCPCSGTGLPWRTSPDPSSQGGPLTSPPLQ